MADFKLCVIPENKDQTNKDRDWGPVDAINYYDWDVIPNHVYGN